MELSDGDLLTVLFAVSYTAQPQHPAPRTPHHAMLETTESGIPPARGLSSDARGVLPGLSVIVPAVHASAELVVCLDRLAALDPPPLEVIVAVDGGDEETVALAQSRGARVVALDPRNGPAAARNAAVRASRGDVLLFIDSDVAVAPDAVLRVLDVLSKNADCDGVFGSYDTQPAAPNLLSQYKNLAHHFMHQTSCEESGSFWSGCGALRRAAFLRVGGFDERFQRPSVEDIDLGMRLAAAGSRIRLEKTLQVSHLKRWTMRTLWRAEIVDRAIPWTRLILRAGHMPNDLNVRWAGRMAVAAATLLAFSAMAAAWQPACLWITGACAALLLSIDAPLFRFFAGVRSLGFAVAAVSCHWVHYVCSGAGLAAGLAVHVATGLWRPASAAVRTTAQTGVRCE